MSNLSEKIPNCCNKERRTNIRFFYFISKYGYRNFTK
jgi:hypothetical protein